MGFHGFFHRVFHHEMCHQSHAWRKSPSCEWRFESLGKAHGFRWSMASSTRCLTTGGYPLLLVLGHSLVLSCPCWHPVRNYSCSFWKRTTHFRSHFRHIFLVHVCAFFTALQQQNPPWPTSDTRFQLVGLCSSIFHPWHPGEKDKAILNKSWPNPYQTYSIPILHLNTFKSSIELNNSADQWYTECSHGLCHQFSRAIQGDVKTLDVRMANHNNHDPKQASTLW